MREFGCPEHITQRNGLLTRRHVQGTNQTTSCWKRQSKSLDPSVTPAQGTNCWAVTRKSYNCNGDCAYANGLPFLAEGSDKVILWSSATNGGMSCRGTNPAG
jgi:hypothetical protein